MLRKGVGQDGKCTKEGQNLALKKLGTNSQAL